MQEKIAVIGLGYVGLPVATYLGEKNLVVAFDINSKRINELKMGFDRTGEITQHQLRNPNIKFINNPEELFGSNFFIVCVPTPVDKNKNPDLAPMESACKTIAPILKVNDVVVFESTVYPGVCEDFCGKLLEELSGLRSGVDFKIGYSPERINPGDKTHNFKNIVKVVAAQDNESLDRIDKVYSSVVEAGTFRASSIKVAEAAKVIENTQRDLNIALMNELAMIFDKLGIDTNDVIDTAATKWNFSAYRPGLVGGHCIGVDPYYLTHCAEKVGVSPKVILSGRSINDSMGEFIADTTISKLIQRGQPLNEIVVTIMGLTFKENCPDVRNTRVFDIFNRLKYFGIKVQIHDPVCSKEDAGIELCSFEEIEGSAAIIFAVAHDEFKSMTPDQIVSICGDKPVVIDVKNMFHTNSFEEYDVLYWRL